jgi:hypothetical protein
MGQTACIPFFEVKNAKPATAASELQLAAPPLPRIDIIMYHHQSLPQKIKLSIPFSVVRNNGFLLSQE